MASPDSGARPENVSIPLLDALPCGVLDLTPDGTVAVLNPVAAGLWGLPADLVQGHVPARVQPAVLPPALVQALAQSTAEPTDYWLPHTQQWIRQRAAPAPAGHRWVFWENVTDRYLTVRAAELPTAAVEQTRAEDALRASEERFRAVVNLVPDLLWCSTSSSETNWYNDRWYEYTGQTPETAAGYGWTDVIHPDDRAEARRRYWAAIADGLPLHQEHRICSAQGEYRWFQVQALPLHDEHGAVSAWYGAATDIHARKQAEQEQLAHLNLHLTQQQALFEAVQETEEAERKRMAEALHNGIGQMLYAVKLRLEQSRALLPAATAAVHALRQETDALLADAIRQVRTLSHELVPMVLEEFGLSDAIQDLCLKVRGTALRVRCQVHLDPESPPLPGPLQLALYRMAQELLQNIVKHALGATQATLELEVVPGFVLLRVEDNGPGFAAASGGDGLGLRAMRDRAMLLGGAMDTGTVPSAGAYVRIRLPVPVVPALA